MCRLMVSPSPFRIQSPDESYAGPSASQSAQAIKRHRSENHADLDVDAVDRQPQALIRLPQS